MWLGGLCDVGLVAWIINIWIIYIGQVEVARL